MERILLNALLITLWVGAMASSCGTQRTQQTDVERGIFQKKTGLAWCSLKSGYLLEMPAGIDTTYSVCLYKLNASLNRWVETDKKRLHISVKIDSSTLHKGVDPFQIRFERKAIEILVREKRTIPVACNTLRRLIHEKKGLIPVGVFSDYSRIEHRALHLVMTGADPVDRIKTWIDSASYYQFNTLILQLTPGILLQSMPKNLSAPSWSKQQFQDVVQYARQSGLKVIPELTLLTKQNKLFAESHPEWLYNEQTYNPENEVMYDQVFALIDELIEICEPTYFHIGHDELHGIKGKPETSHVRVLPQRLFIADVERINKYLQDKGVQTMMWSDMLLNPELFPEMRKVSLLGMNGYENTASFIPKGVIQCDWHYKDVLETYPSSTWLNEQGFEVWGATWDNLETIDNFAAYMARANMRGDKGMIATTWHRVLKNISIETIIKHAGNAFWKA